MTSFAEHAPALAGAFLILETHMRRLMAAAAFLALVVPVTWADDKDAAKKLEGTYEVLSVRVGGKADDKKKEDVKTFIIKDGTITIKESKREDTAKFTVDATKKPAHIDIAPAVNEKVLGIYETKETDKGLELTITFNLEPKAERPKDFKGEGPETVVVKLLRKKEK